MKSPSISAKLNQWVQESAAMCEPDDIYWCDGSVEEYNRFMAQMVASGMAIPLKKRPNSFLFRSDPSDVARVEDRTYISTPTKVEAAPPTTGSTRGSSRPP
jgi:phosphoenolpyruvate carboxykinase (GTP)